MYKNKLEKINKYIKDKKILFGIIVGIIFILSIGITDDEQLDRLYSFEIDTKGRSR